MYGQTIYHVSFGDDDNHYFGSIATDYFFSRFSIFAEIENCLSFYFHFVFGFLRFVFLR
jgi:hypothetical protein